MELMELMELMEDTELCFPQLPNSSCRIAKSSRSATLLTYTVLSFVSLLTMTLNLLVIISISHFKQLHSPTNVLLLSLAVSDFIIGFLMLFQMMTINGCWLLGDLMCSLYYVLACVSTSASIGNMVLISMDRYVAICYPLHYPVKVTQHKARVCVSLCWTCSALSNGLLQKGSLEQPGLYKSCHGECVFVVDYVSGRVDLFLSLIGPVTIIVVLYMRVFIEAVSQARAVRSQTVTVSPQGSVSRTAKKSELKAARTLGVVIVGFLICLCPYFSATLTGQDALFNTSFSAFAICLLYFNSCVNPIIYAFFYPWFRKSIRLIVTLEILQPGSCQANIS